MREMQQRSKVNQSVFLICHVLLLLLFTYKLRITIDQEKHGLEYLYYLEKKFHAVEAFRQLQAPVQSIHFSYWYIKINLGVYGLQSAYDITKILFLAYQQSLTCDFGEEDV